MPTRIEMRQFFVRLGKSMVVMGPPTLVLVLVEIADPRILEFWQNVISYIGRDLAIVGLGATVEILVHPCSIFGGMRKRNAEPWLIVSAVLINVIIVFLALLLGKPALENERMASWRALLDVALGIGGFVLPIALTMYLDHPRDANATPIGTEQAQG